MRWLFIILLLLLVASVVSIVWLGDYRQWPRGAPLSGPPALQRPV